MANISQENSAALTVTKVLLVLLSNTGFVHEKAMFPTNNYLINVFTALVNGIFQ